MSRPTHHPRPHLDPGPAGAPDLALIALAAAKADARRTRSQPLRASTKRAARRGSAKPLPLRAVLMHLLADQMSWLTSQAVAQWPAAAGEDMTKHVKAVGFDAEAKALLLDASSLAWGTLVRLHGPALLRRLQQRCGADAVLRLRVTVSTVPPANRPLVAIRPGNEKRRIDLRLAELRERQARHTPREPTPLTPGGTPDADDARSAGLAHGRALARARQQHQQTAENQQPPLQELPS